MSRAAFAPWARSDSTPLNEYYNNHNSNTIAFHRWVGGGGNLLAHEEARVAGWGGEAAPRARGEPPTELADRSEANGKSVVEGGHMAAPGAAAGADAAAATPCPPSQACPHSCCQGDGGCRRSCSRKGSAAVMCSGCALPA